jgi:hypothetical protein
VPLPTQKVSVRRPWPAVVERSASGQEVAMPALSPVAGLDPRLRQRLSHRSVVGRPACGAVSCAKAQRWKADAEDHSVPKRLLPNHWRVIE